MRNWNWGFIGCMVFCIFFWLAVLRAVLTPEQQAIFGLDILPVKDGELWELNPV